MRNKNGRCSSEWEWRWAECNGTSGTEAPFSRNRLRHFFAAMMEAYRIRTLFGGGGGLKSSENHLISKPTTVPGPSRLHTVDTYM
jgi:hypothetical protein